jgi:hypothetical protein
MSDLITTKFNIFSNFDIGEEKEETKKYILYGPLLESSFTGKNNFNGRNDVIYFYPTKEINDCAKNFEGQPVDFNHDNNPIGVVKKVFQNTEGYTTKTGKITDADDLWHCEVEVELSKDIDINNYGFSVEVNADRLVCEDRTYNATPCDFILSNIKPKFVSIVDRENARFTASKEIKNSIEEEKKINNLTNKNSALMYQKNIFMNEDILNKIMNQFKDGVSQDLKNSMDELKQEISNIKIKNEEDKEKEEKEEIKNQEAEGMQLVLEKIGKIEEMLEKLTESNVKNSEEDKKEEDKQEEDKQDGIKNSIDKINIKNKTNDGFSVYNDKFFI